MTKLSRIYGLDAMRAILLIGGPVVHSVLEHHRTPAFSIVQESTHLFRMAAFFAISGFLVALIPAAQEPGWLKVRMRQLLVPLISMSIVLFVIMFCIGTEFYKSIGGSTTYPLHLWFLFSLIIVAPVPVLLDQWNVSQRITALLDKYPYLLPLVTAGLAVVQHLLTSLIWKRYITDTPGPSGILLMVLIVQPTEYVIFYLLGFFLARSKGTLTFFNRPITIVIGLLCFVIALIFYYFYQDALKIPYAQSPNKSLKFILLFEEEIISVLMSLAVLIAALRMRTVHKWVMAFSRSSYTIYLFHYPVIMISATVILIYRPDITPYPLYISLVLTSLIASYGIHLIIARSQLLSFLFNGKKMMGRNHN